MSGLRSSHVRQVVAVVALVFIGLSWETTKYSRRGVLHDFAQSNEDFRRM